MGPCEADASSDPEASLELEVPSEPLADLGDVSVSVRSSSDLEAVITLDATVVGMP